MPKVVAPRNDLQLRDVMAMAHGHRLDKRDPNFHYQAFSPDPSHPNFIGKYLTKQRLPNTGKEAEPFEVCTVGMAEQGRKREDQGEGVDTVLRNGDLIWARTPLANAALFNEDHAAHVRATDVRQRTERRGVGSLNVSSKVGAEQDRQRNLVTGS